MARLFPRSLREVVGKAAQPIMRKRGFAESRLLLDWPVIVGETLAHHTQPLKMHFPRGESTQGTLTIACTPAFAPELQQLSPVLLDKLATHLGYRAIARIVIEQRHFEAEKTQARTKLKPAIADEIFSEDPVINALKRFEKIRNLGDDNTNKQQ